MTTAIDSPRQAERQTDRQTERHVVCTVCDIGCQLRPVVTDGKLTQILPHENPLLAHNICFKGTAAPQIHNHPDRLRVPLKRAGERGEDRWEEISYEQAMDEIAQKLMRIVATHGPEALAVSTSGWNTQVTHGLDRRFMNLLGSPNWISGVALCAGNTAAVNKFTYGWMPFPDIMNSKCVVLIGHNPKRHSWTPIFNMINLARLNGAKLIVIDPRVSEQAAQADLHLSLRAGSDAAMLLGWLHVIITEELYDADFVRDWTIGWDDLRARVAEYPLERVEEITGVDREQIRAAARMYATAESAVIPWTPITDQQISSTSGIRLQSILRAVTGNLDVVGGESLGGFNPDYIPESRMQFHEALSQEQRDKQLGSRHHPAFTYRAQDLLADATERVWGYRYADLVMGCYMANPTAVFRAMADGDPYPVKAFITLGNNTLLSYPNQHQIHRGLLNQELIVAHEIFMTPTAMLADYVLPGDVFSERNHIADTWSWTTRLTVNERVVDPPAESSSTFRFWRDLAHRFGFGEHFPSRRCSISGCRRRARRSSGSCTTITCTPPPPSSASTSGRASPPRRARSSWPPVCWPNWASTRCPTTGSRRWAPTTTTRTRSSPACARTPSSRRASATFRCSGAGCRGRSCSCTPTTPPARAWSRGTGPGSRRGPAAWSPPSR